MRYRLRRIPDVIRAFGPAELLRGLMESASPPLFGLAQAHRRMLLRSLAEIPARQRLVVLGDGDQPPGDPEAAHRAFGEHAARIADRLVLITDDHLAAYRVGAERGGLSPGAVDSAGASVAAAVDAVAARLDADDVVLVKGRARQRLGRVALALAGRTVRCDLPACFARIRCEHCPMLERGGSGRRVPFGVMP